MFCLISSSLRPLDVEFMKALHEKVNIVPVLAKADTLTPGEVKKKKIKARRLHVSSHESICVYAAECFTCILTEDVIHTLTSDMFFFADQRGDWAVRYKDIPVPRLRLWWRWRFQATRPWAEGDQWSPFFLFFIQVFVFSTLNSAESRMLRVKSLSFKTNCAANKFNINKNWH